MSLQSCIVVLANKPIQQDLLLLKGTTVASSVNVRSLKGYISAGRNIIISGRHGVGKTAKLKEAVDQLGLSLKYYSASTLDPYTDLVGIPVPQNETKTVEYYRPHEIDKAEVIFFDEINRADPKTLNTLMEIILNHSINGEPLPKLKAVVAAMNPVTADYETDELDKALMDRFEIFLNADPEADGAYFVKKFGDEIGQAAVEWWNEYHRSVKNSEANASSRNKVPYISPRRLDMIVETFVAIPSRQTVEDCMPPEVTDSSVTRTLHSVLAAAKKAAERTPADDLKGSVSAITNLPISQQRRPEVATKAKALLANPDLAPTDRAFMLTSLATSLNESVGIQRLKAEFTEVIEAMMPSQLTTLTEQWSPAKLADFKRQFPGLKLNS